MSCVGQQEMLFSLEHGMLSCWQAEQRAAELFRMSVDVKLITVGKKGGSYFKRRSNKYNIVGELLSRYNLHAGSFAEASQVLLQNIMASNCNSDHLRFSADDYALASL